MQLHYTSERTVGPLIAVILVTQVSEIDMACHNFFFKWISVLIKDSSLARNILHRSLNCVAFVTVSISVCTLLLHSLHIHSLSILYDIFWT